MNACLDRLAKKREITGDALPEVVDPGPEPGAALAAAEVAEHVNAALARLPETQRIAVTLCHYQGLRNIEAAEVMAVSIEALESLLARARRTLRAELRAVAPALLGGS
jgi:RNA polymerase sigma-70 factor (ECF subfamily)